LHGLRTEEVTFPSVIRRVLATDYRKRPTVCLYADVAGEEDCALRATIDSPPPERVQYRELMLTNERFRKALTAIAACPNPNSVEDCHNLMSDIAKAALNG
jgi:hypothetical protein